jgi:Uma2 family endonuclease
MTTRDYFAMPETNQPSELVYGVVREPPAPFYGHQKVVGELFRILKAHAEACDLGDVCISPIDVVLDEHAALVVQPDVIFVAKARSGIIRNQVWGAPDLVADVVSPGAVASFSESHVIRSAVLPELNASAADCFR